MARRILLFIPISPTDSRAAPDAGIEAIAKPASLTYRRRDSETIIITDRLDSTTSRYLCRRYPGSVGMARQFAVKPERIPPELFGKLS
jgi:hypothetical protein